MQPTSHFCWIRAIYYGNEFNPRTKMDKVVTGREPPLRRSTPCIADFLIMLQNKFKKEEDNKATNLQIQDIGLKTGLYYS